MHKEIVCGLDIGGASIRALIAQQAEAREKILAFSEVPTRGFSKGVVSNLSLLSDAIEEAISKAETTAQCKVRKVITDVSGVHIRTFKSRGSVHISDRPSEIKEEDVKRCVESAKLIAMSLDREVIHLVPEKFYIDDRMEISEPLGLFGSKLDVDVNIVTSLVSILQNVTKAINFAGHEVEDVVIPGMATSLAIFDAKELEEGAAIIDVGKDIIEVTLFLEAKLQDCFYFPFGSDDLTQVLQDKLRIMFEEAEELRTKYGIVTKLGGDLCDDSSILISSIRTKPGPGRENTQSNEKILGGNWVDDTGARLFKGERPGVVSRREISNLLFPKVEEIMQNVYKKIEPFLRQRKKSPHIRVVGGISKMDGFIEVIEEIFNAPVNIGRILNIKDFQETKFACSLGLARYGLKKRAAKRSGRVLDADSLTGRFVSRVRALFSDYF